MTERLRLVDTRARSWWRGAALIAPVTPVLASRMGPVGSGDTVLDVACGRGEPGLSLIEAIPGARLIGVDIAPSMIDGARAEAQVRGIADARFEVGSAEALPLEDGTVETVVSRMGMLGFPGSSVDSAHEAFRVLRPGGRLAIAAWNRWEEQTAAVVNVAARRAVVDGMAIDMTWADELADGRRERWLAEAGFARIISEPLSWAMRFADVDALWEMGDLMPALADATAAADAPARAAAREHLAASAAHYRRPDGSYAVPVTARLVTAARP